MNEIDLRTQRVLSIHIGNLEQALASAQAEILRLKEELEAKGKPAKAKAA